MRLPRRLPAVAALATLAAACSDSPSAPPPSADRGAAPLDVAPLLAEMTLPAMPSVAAAGPLSLPFAPGGTPTVPSNCPYDATSKSFVCPVVTTAGLTLNVAYTLLDAAGKPLATADKNATAAIRTVSTAKGTIAAPAGSTVSGTLTVDQRQELTLSGLLAGPHKLDGTSSSRIDGKLAVGGLSVPLNGTTTQTVAGLVLPTVAPGTPAWPTAGTLTFESTTSALGAAATTVRAQMTFNGTSTATLTITIGALTQRCTVNLAGNAAPVCTG